LPRSAGAITLFVEDPQRSKAFYEKVFDLSPVYEDEDAAAFKFDNTIINLLRFPAARELIAPGAVAGPDAHPVTGKQGHGPVPVDTTADQIAEADFDALVIPGGYAPDKLRRSETVLDLVRAFDDAAKPIAFICHAGWVPISAKIIKGRRATSVGAIRDDMVNAGADWVDEATVVDGNLITGQNPASSQAATDRTVGELEVRA